MTKYPNNVTGNDELYLDFFKSIYMWESTLHNGEGEDVIAKAIFYSYENCMTSFDKNNPTDDEIEVIKNLTINNYEFARVLKEKLNG